MSVADGTALELTPSASTNAPVEDARTGRRSVVRRFMRDKFAVAGAIFILLLALVAIFAPQLAKYPPDELYVDGAAAFESPSSTHWLGTDGLGRDNASRLIYGARIALLDSLQVVSVALLIGVPLGVIAGFRGGWFDNVTMRVMDMIISVPGIIFILVVAEAADQELRVVLLAVSLIYVPTLARLVRATTLTVREEVFIEASTGIGTPTRRILRKRILPNVTSPIIVQGSIYMGSAIFVQAALAVIGIGYPVGTEAWGSMLNDAFQQIYSNFWNMMYPGLAIALTVLAFNLIGDGLRDAFGLDKGNLYGRRVSVGLTLPARKVTARDRAAATHTDPDAPLLEVSNLTVEVATTSREPLTVVDDVSFTLARGEVMALVGESGAGKTVTSLSIMRLLPTPPFTITNGSIRFDGRNLVDLGFHDMRRIRGNEIAMIFQDPMMGLNPAYTVGRQIAEVVELHEGASRRVAMRRAVEMLDRVGIPAANRRVNSYPHEFSGGMRQRVMIAIALACSPKLLIADEPTTALDVTVQAQILEVLRELQHDFGLSVIFVTHDLGVVAELCDRAIVMYAGEVVEQAAVRDLFAQPTHPYTEGLLAAVPKLGEGHGTFVSIPGQVPPLGALPSGCRFHPRCRYAIDACAEQEVEIVAVGASQSRCIRALDLPKVRS